MRMMPLLLLTAVTTTLHGQAPVTQTVPVAPDVSIRIFNLAGTITIAGWDKDSVRVTHVVPSEAGRFFLGGVGASLKLGVEGVNRPDAPGATLHIQVPRRARVWVKSATARIEVEGVRGELDLASVSGGILARNVTGVLTAESMDGPLSISGDLSVLRLKSGDGAITIQGGASDLTVSTVSGAISTQLSRELASGRIESVTGRVTFAGPVSPAGMLDLQTHAAPIILALPASQSATLDVIAFSGKVLNGFPGARRVATPGEPVRYTLLGGAARIAVRSLKGGVSIRELQPGVDSNGP
jgi:hypothetical protein